MVVGHEVGIRRLRSSVQVVRFRGGECSDERIEARIEWGLRHDRINGPGWQRVGKNARASANHRRTISAPRRPGESDLRLGHDSCHRRERCVQPAVDCLVDRGRSIHLSKRTGKPLEAVGLADWVGKVIQPQAERQFQLVGNPHVVRAIEPHLIQCDGFLGLLREVLDDHISGTPTASGNKVAESEFNDFWSHELERVVADIVAAEVHSNFEVVASPHPTEVVDNLVLRNPTSLWKEHIQAVQRLQ